MSRDRSLLGVHHFTLPAANLDQTVAFYTTHLTFTYLPSLDHINASTGAVYAKILRHPSSGTTLEIRDAPDQAAKQRRWDPITWTVRDRKALEQWQQHFSGAGVAHSRVFTGAKGWVLCAEDPDGRVVRLYTLEEHEMTSDTDHDEYWLGHPNF